ncbi:MAG: type II toxin-antitoxin system HicB family antitoxin [Ignavibacteria bacterium]
MSYLAVIKKYGNGYSAYIPDVPGCVSAADTKRKTIALLKEALIIHLNDNTEIPKEQTDLVVIKFDKNLIPLKN